MQYSSWEKDYINFIIIHDNDYFYIDIFRVLLSKIGQEIYN